MYQEIKEVLDKNIIYLNFGGDTWLNIFIKNSLNCTPIRVNITVCKLEINIPDLEKEVQSTKDFFLKSCGTQRDH